MPVLNPDVATERATIVDRRERQRRRQQNANQKHAPVSHAIMTGQSVQATIPAASTPAGEVVLPLKAPTIRQSSLLIRRIWNEWPDVLVMAALATSEVGSGVDVEETAAFWTRSRKATAGEGQAAEDATPAEVQSQIRGISNAIAMGDETDERYPLRIVAETLAMVCDPLPVDAEELPGWIADTFQITEIADVLRVIWNAAGGTPGEMQERFGERH